MASESPLRYSARWSVRQYELDSFGHVNNAVYLNYAEQVASEHAEALGFGRDWSLAQGGGWFCRRTEIDYLRPAVHGDELEVTVEVERMTAVRAWRRTWIRRLEGRDLLSEILTEWAWVRLSDGRPVRIPRQLRELMPGRKEA